MLNYFREKYENPRLVSLRLTNSYGFMCSQKSKWRAPVVNDFISSAHQKGVITMQSDGSPFRDFIEISSLIQVCLKLIHSNNVPKNIIVGSGVTLNLSYIANSIRDIFAMEFEKKITINTSSEITKPETKASPRYLVDDHYCKRQSVHEIGKQLKKLFWTLKGLYNVS